MERYDGWFYAISFDAREEGEGRLVNFSGFWQVYSFYFCLHIWPHFYSVVRCVHTDETAER